MRRWLRFRVHLDAFRSDPAAYLTAAKSRILGLKLRSRHQFSALLGHSSKAYDLWMASREQPAPQSSTAAIGELTQANVAPILAVVDCRGTAATPAPSIASLIAASCDHVVVLGGPAAAVTDGRVSHVADLPALADRLEGLSRDRAWVLAIEAGDLVSTDAIAAYRTAIADHPGAVRFYADDDLIDDDGHRHTPHFKPSWNSELARHLDYISGASLFACNPRIVGIVWPSGEIAGPPPVRITRVLHHRRRRMPVQVPAPVPCDHNPLVTVMIPTRDNVHLLRKCLEGLRATAYQPVECLIIDNGSTDAETVEYLQEIASGTTKVIREPGAFNYAGMHNRAMVHARGGVLCFLNNDIEMIDNRWLNHMVARALRSDVGAVGAKLLYPDHTIQHAGVVTGIGGGAAHAHRLLDNRDPGYFSRAHLPQFITAVTAACLVVERHKFEAVGGFNAEDFAVAFNDVDLCMKLNRQGWQSFYEPAAVLIHHESKSRGQDDTPVKRERFAGELAALKRIWHTDAERDPFHHPELSVFSEKFVVQL